MSVTDTATVTDEVTELDALDPLPEELTLTTGMVVIYEDLRTKQFFKLLRILTHGALPWLGNGDLLRITPGDSVEEFYGKLIAMTLMALPDAEEESIAFVKSLVRPKGLFSESRRMLNQQERQHDDDLWATLDLELENPDLEDLVSIIEGVIKREASDIQALGKRVQGWFRLAQKTGQLPKGLNPPPTMSPSTSAGSPEPSTSSVPTTEATSTQTVNSLLLNSSDNT